MKRQDLVKYQNASSIELEKAIDTLGSQLVDARLQLRMGELKNVHQIKKVRQDIARLKTIHRLKALSGNTSATAVQSPAVKSKVKKESVNIKTTKKVKKA
jgi:ribosomal protein L29